MNYDVEPFEGRAYGASKGCHMPAKTSLDTTKRNSDDEEDPKPVQKGVCLEVVSFLGSLPVPLQHVDWKPDYTRCFNKKEEGDGQWHAEIRLTAPYGNVYDQGFVTKKTSRKLAKYHKLSDIMSLNWFQE
ncbi:hypothetical protein Tco_0913223 [Tanacetum coccineum]